MANTGEAPSGETYDGVLDSREKFLFEVFSGARPAPPELVPEGFQPSLLGRLRRLKGRNLALPAAGMAIMLVGLVQMLRRGEASSGRNRTAFGPSSLVSAETLGVTAQVSELLPIVGGGTSNAEEAVSPNGAGVVLGEGIVVPAATPTPRLTPRTRVGVAGEGYAGGRAGDAELRVRRRAAKEEIVLFSDEAGETLGIVVSAATEAVQAALAPAVVNLGRSFRATIAQPLYTGASVAPATAVVEEDVCSGDVVVIPRGATLVGEGISVRSDDRRAQILFRSIVFAGRTHSITAVAMDEKLRVGVEGRLIRKGSRKRGWTGRAVSAVGSAVTFGLVKRRTNAAMAAADRLTTGLGSDLDRTGNRWMADMDDKVIHVAGGVAVVVYLQADFKVAPR